MIKFEMVSLGSHLGSGVVPFWKIGHFGRVEGGLEVGWGLAGWPSLLKMLEPKDPIRAR